MLLYGNDLPQENTAYIKFSCHMALKKGGRNQTTAKKRTWSSDEIVSYVIPGACQFDPAA